MASNTYSLVDEVRADDNHLIGRIYRDNPSGHVWTADVWLLDKSQDEITRWCTAVNRARLPSHCICNLCQTVLGV